MAGSRETIWEGIALLGIYSLGLAMPFIIMSLFINFLIVFMKKVAKVIKYVNFGSGVLLILVGLFLLTGQFIF